ncbi:conserved protein, unknown function [Hepatocystis sp. ex Piliocolobus tephrosceles]|nr:conserved protein, unknown function [Hepatocystis sp. ex Piliocolobus tephrosceles]
MDKKKTANKTDAHKKRDVKHNSKMTEKKQEKKSETGINKTKREDGMNSNKKNNPKVEKIIGAKNNRVINIANNNNKKNAKVIKNNNSGGCFLSSCCCNSAESEQINELIVEDDKVVENKEKERLTMEYEDAVAQEENAKIKKIREEENKRLKKLQEEQEEKKKQEEQEKLKIDENVNTRKRDTILIHKDIKGKVFTKKKAIMNFKGAASAPDAPDVTACVGDPPKVKETKVPVGKGIYLIYNTEENGKLEIHYSKEAIKGSGILAYIGSCTIPDFYFEQKKKKEIICTNISNKMQSEFINDRKPYYECYIEFMKLKKKFNGILYFLPAFGAQPPPKLDIMFYNTKEKKIIYAPLEQPVEFVGEYIFVIQKGLDIFKDASDLEKLYSYVGSYGAMINIS